MSEPRIYVKSVALLHKRMKERWLWGCCCGGEDVEVVKGTGRALCMTAVPLEPASNIKLSTVATLR